MKVTDLNEVHIFCHATAKIRLGEFFINLFEGGNS